MDVMGRKSQARTGSEGESSSSTCDRSFGSQFALSDRGSSRRTLVMRLCSPEQPANPRVTHRRRAHFACGLGPITTASRYRGRPPEPASGRHIHPS